MSKDKEKQEVKVKRLKSNPKVDEIVNDYPDILTAYPRGSFEHQLKKHLLKHGIK